MQKVLKAEEMREVDRLTTEKYGIPSIILMENAAHATARVIVEKLGGSVKEKSFLILCGKGNNGGDGAALARILTVLGANVNVYLFGNVEDTKGDALTNFRILQRMPDSGEDFGLRFYSNADFVKLSAELIADIEESNSFDVVIDAIVGTGLTRPLDEALFEALEVSLQFLTYKDSYPLRLSVDIPSGLNADMASPIGESLLADATVTFTAPKLANILPPVSSGNGKLHILNIGSPVELIDSSPSQTFLAELEDAKNGLDRTVFSDGSYKSKRGNVFIVAGSKKYSGAAVLAGGGAMQSGAGLVTVATPESTRSAVSERVLAEVMVEGVEETESGAINVNALVRIEELAKKADVIGIGSGLGSEEKSTRDLVRKVVENRQTPMVIDADGLNALSPFDLDGSDELPLILTPHEGEFLGLLGTDDKVVIKDRVQAVREFAQKHRVILVLKGERTLIAEPSGKVVINPTGNSGLGKAGNGDNLMGIITGFVAQAVQAEVDIFETVVAAVYIAGLAGDIAEKKFGKRTMLASDVRDCLVEAFAEVEKIDGGYKRTFTKMDRCI